MENYIEKIQQILAKTNWSQAQFAQEIGVTFATVNRWLNRRTKPHPGQLRRIERIYKTIVGLVSFDDAKIGMIIADVEAKKNKFPSIAEMLYDRTTIDEFLLELTYNSDAIEGNRLTKQETETIIFDKATIKNKSLIEHLEAGNHAVILRDIFAQRIVPPVTERVIRNIHKMLMQGIREDAGEYSKHQRVIRGVDLILPHPDDIPHEMEAFLVKLNRFKSHPIEHIAAMHADFEAIHPFGDGNGRVGRLIMIIQLIDKGYAPCAVALDDKAEYYEYLEYAQKKSSRPLVYFIAKSILKGYEILEKAYS